MVCAPQYYTTICGFFHSFCTLNVVLLHFIGTKKRMSEDILFCFLESTADKLDGRVIAQVLALVNDGKILLGGEVQDFGLRSFINFLHPLSPPQLSTLSTTTEEPLGAVETISAEYSRSERPAVPVTVSFAAMESHLWT